MLDSFSPNSPSSSTSYGCVGNVMCTLSTPQAQEDNDLFNDATSTSSFSCSCSDGILCKDCVELSKMLATLLDCDGVDSYGIPIVTHGLEEFEEDMFEVFLGFKDAKEEENTNKPQVTLKAKKTIKEDFRDTNMEIMDLREAILPHPQEFSLAEIKEKKRRTRLSFLLIFLSSYKPP